MAFIAESSFIPSSDLQTYWAKSTGESVTSHTLRVLENLRQLRMRTPTLDRLSGSPKFWSRLALAAALHDLGKCSAGFQSMLRGGPRFPHRHEVLSAVFVSWILRNDVEDSRWVAAAILTHHKDWSAIDQYYPPSEDGSGDALDSLLQQMSPNFFSVAIAIAATTIFPKLARDWTIPEGWLTASFSTWLPTDPVRELRFILELVRGIVKQNQAQTSADLPVIAGTLMRGAIIFADHSGSAWEDLRNLPSLSDPDRALFSLQLSRSGLYPHQVEMMTTVGNSILIAPTGSGKTESALIWASRQNAARGGQCVLYYVLPYQASLNAMYRRLAVPFAGCVALQHSRAVQALYRQQLDKHYEPEHAESVAKQERNLASLSVHPLRISTPYQLLKGAFQLRGHEVLWTVAAGALFVIDEIHVYETSRLAILLATLRYLCVSLGGSVLIMSATLPSYLVEILGKLLPEISLSRADPLTLKAFRRHQVRLLEAGLLDDSVANAIISASADGLSVLVVATTVGRAQEVWRELRKRGCRVELMHGRFHADDRAAKESRLIELIGVGSSRPRPGIILVATQVVEVSLNVDFDVLFSDPAPLEALFQRFGRVNRGRRVPLATVNLCRFLPEGSPVYPQAVVQKALDVLESYDGQPLDEEHIQAMVDEVYSDGLGLSLSQHLEEEIQRFSRDILSTCRPFFSDESVEQLFEKMFDGFEVLPASLVSEYDRRSRESPLLAPGLLIPITSGQYYSLRNRGLVRFKDGVMVADCEYGEMGLALSGPKQQDGV